MYPVNQVFLGNADPLIAGTDINSELQRLRQYEAQLMKLTKGTLHGDLIWDNIDREMGTLTERQKLRFYEDPEYKQVDDRLNTLVHIELINLVKSKIESTAEGQELLKKQLQTVKRLKEKIVTETDNEMALFNRFREVSAGNPSLTYEEFCRQWKNM